MAKASYKSAGVDLDKYQDAMQRLPAIMHRTFNPRVMKLDGGFAGLFQLDFANKLFARHYRDPVLVACTDGVGTKLQVAGRCQRHDTVGIDLVAMCVNDAICCGAEPLFFLDYIALGQDDPPLLEQLVRGVGEGCLQADCALLGGETAIMPDLYRPGDYDMAGFCVGVVEKSRVIDGKAIAAGDVVIGVASNGVHSNGYSLVRKIVFDIAGLSVDQHIEALGETVGDALLRPTHIYAQVVRRILERLEDGEPAIHGIAHITGGGLQENLARILPADKSARIAPGSWRVPPVFGWLQQLGEVDDKEMQRVFNMGLGLAIVTSRQHVQPVMELLSNHGYDSWEVGQITSGDGSVTWHA